MIERVIVQFSNGYEAVYDTGVTLDAEYNVDTGITTTVIKAGAGITRTTPRELTLEDGSKVELPR